MICALGANKVECNFFAMLIVNWAATWRTSTSHEDFLLTTTFWKTRLSQHAGILQLCGGNVGLNLCWGIWKHWCYNSFTKLCNAESWAWL